MGYQEGQRRYTAAARAEGVVLKLERGRTRYDGEGLMANGAEVASNHHAIGAWRGLEKALDATLEGLKVYERDLRVARALLESTVFHAAADLAMHGDVNHATMRANVFGITDRFTPTRQGDAICVFDKGGVRLLVSESVVSLEDTRLPEERSQDPYGIDCDGGRKWDVQSKPSLAWYSDRGSFPGAPEDPLLDPESAPDSPHRHRHHLSPGEVLVVPVAALAVGVSRAQAFAAIRDALFIAVAEHAPGWAQIEITYSSYPGWASKLVRVGA
jgi:hypothetical protein